MRPSFQRGPGCETMNILANAKGIPEDRSRERNLESDSFCR